MRVCPPNERRSGVLLRKDCPHRPERGRLIWILIGIRRIAHNDLPESKRLRRWAFKIYARPQGSSTVKKLRPAPQFNEPRRIENGLRQACLFEDLVLAQGDNQHLSSG